MKKLITVFKLVVLLFVLFSLVILIKDIIINSAKML